jgi:hypothetical protein
MKNLVDEGDSARPGPARVFYQPSDSGYDEVIKWNTIQNVFTSW